MYEADACHDLDIAVSPTLVATATNSGHIVFYKKDGTVDHVADKPACCGDQHIQWDDQSQRWFFNIFLDINNGGPVGVYATTDAAGTSWNGGVTVTINDATGQPASVDDVQLSVTTDKVLLTNANCIVAVEKATVLAGGGGTVSPPASCVQNTQGQIWDVHNGFPEPSTAYYCNMYDGTLDWLSVDGTGTSIMVHEHTVKVPGFTSFPVSPGVPQPGGGTLRASGSNGMWHNNDLWCAGPSQCGGVSCQHMFHVRTDSGMLVNDFDFSQAGAYVWSGSPGIDRSGNMWSLMSVSSTTLFPSLLVGGFSAAGMKTDPQMVFMGTQSIGMPTTFGVWGDFTNCAQDPSDGSVWCIDNYGGAPTQNCSDAPAKMAHITTK